MPQFSENFGNWARGVISDGRPDKIPHDAALEGKNAALVHITKSPPTALPQKRLGCSIQSAVGITNKPPIIGLSWFRRRSGATYTDFSLGITEGESSNAGRLDKLASSSWSAADSGTAAPFTTGRLLPSMEVMNNLWFVVNGTDQKKFDGTNILNFGMVAPDVTTDTLAAAEGAAGNPANSTYEFKWTFLNSATGHESSSSALVSITLTGTNKITLTWDVSVADEQVDFVRIYARDTAVQSTLFRLSDTGVTGGTYSSVNGGWPLGDGDAGGLEYNLTATQLTNLIIKAPSTTENDPPSATSTFITKHVSRMLYTDGIDLFYSKIDLPEAFPAANVEPVNPDDGQRIIGLLHVSEGDDAALLIFKEFSTYVLIGSDPDTWEVRLVSDSIGLSAIRGLTALDGIAYWWSQFGPYSWSAGSGMVPLGFGTISNEFAEDKITTSKLNEIIVDKDVERQRIFFSYAETGMTRNTKMLVFNHQLQVWEGTWDPMDVSALGNLPDSNGAAFLHIGNYKGRVFRIWDGTTDGARISSGGTTFTLSGSPTSSGNTTLTDTGATFDTTDDGLDDLVILAISSDNVVQRRIITSSTGTVITVNSAWTINPTSGYTYVIASPDFVWTTYYSDRVQGRDGFFFSSPFRRKRYKKFLFSALSSTGNAVVTIDVFLNGERDSEEFTLRTTADQIAGAVFGTGVFGTAVFGGAGTTIIKKRLGRTGRNIGYRIRNREPNTQLLLLDIGHMATTVSTKL